MFGGVVYYAKRRSVTSRRGDSVIREWDDVIYRPICALALDKKSARGALQRDAHQVLLVLGLSHAPVVAARRTHHDWTRGAITCWSSSGVHQNGGAVSSFPHTLPAISKIAATSPTFERPYYRKPHKEWLLSLAGKGTASIGRIQPP
jgi:hypothetical protein